MDDFQVFGGQIPFPVGFSFFHGKKSFPTAGMTTVSGFSRSDRSWFLFYETDVAFQW